jgi:hypothetical protein
MPDSLYLDTARFGRMRRSAAAALADFARLCSDEGSSLAVESLLVGGYWAWPTGLRDRYPNLATWRGLDGLREAVRSVAGAVPRTAVFFAARAATLMRLAARMLARRCRTILHTDLEWGGFVEILRREAGRRDSRVVALPIRGLIEREGLDAAEVSARIAEAFSRRGCDGLFLSDISWDGIRLPLAQLESLMAEVRCSVIDGSQALGHAPPALAHADIYLAGGQKWLRAGHPIGIAIASRPGFAECVASVRREDPLLDLLVQHDSNTWLPHGETADLSAFFCLDAAARDAVRRRDATDGAFSRRLSNAETTRSIGRECGWRAVHEGHGLRSGIVRLRRDCGHMMPAARLRAELTGRGVACSAYDDGSIRLSMIGQPFEDEDLELIDAALHAQAAARIA